MDICGNGLIKGGVVMQDHYIIYTDGSFNKNKDEAGFSAIFIDDSNELETVLYGKVIDTQYVDSWNVGGEIYAVEEAVNYALNNAITDLEIYHDYIGLEKWYSGKWRCKNNLTRAYRAFLIAASSKITINFHWVKGHSNNIFNDLADRYAKKGLSLNGNETKTVIVKPKEHERIDVQ